MGTNEEPAIIADRAAKVTRVRMDVKRRGEGSGRVYYFLVAQDGRVVAAGEPEWLRILADRWNWILEE